MMRSLFAAVSGLRQNQTAMDVIGNNIANVNTPGFKTSRVTFQQLFSQTLRAATRPTATSGGLNPTKVGLGVQLGSIDKLMEPGSIQGTGRPTDVAIQGDGFFVVSDGTQTYYTRVGNLGRDADGYLVDASTGARLLGVGVDGQLQAIHIPLGTSNEPHATTTVTFANNLDAGAPEGTAVTLYPLAYASNGNAQQLAITLTRAASVGATTDWNVTLSDGTDTPPTLSPAVLSFDGTGNVTGDTTLTATVGGQPLTFDFSAVTGYAGSSSVSLVGQDGYPAGELSAFAIGTDGEVTGAYSNGLTRSLGTIAVATFSNPNGLQEIGGGRFVASNNSGEANLGAPGDGDRGILASSSLEMSNVDLAQQFTDMIVTQRAYQANARVITTSDEMLQELANLKR